MEKEWVGRAFSRVSDFGCFLQVKELGFDSQHSLGACFLENMTINQHLHQSSTLRYMSIEVFQIFPRSLRVFCFHVVFLRVGEFDNMFLYVIDQGFWMFDNKYYFFCTCFF